MLILLISWILLFRKIALFSSSFRVVLSLMRLSISATEMSIPLLWLWMVLFCKSSIAQDIIRFRSGLSISRSWFSKVSTMFSQSLSAEKCKDNIVFVLCKLLETYRFRYCYLLHCFKCENIGHSRNIISDYVDFGFVARSVEMIHCVDVLTEISI